MLCLCMGVLFPRGGSPTPAINMWSPDYLKYVLLMTCAVVEGWGRGLAAFTSPHHTFPAIWPHRKKSVAPATKPTRKAASQSRKTLIPESAYWSAVALAEGPLWGEGGVAMCLALRKHTGGESNKKPAVGLAVVECRWKSCGMMNPPMSSPSFSFRGLGRQPIRSKCRWLLPCCWFVCKMARASQSEAGATSSGLCRQN